MKYYQNTISTKIIRKIYKNKKSLLHDILDIDSNQQQYQLIIIPKNHQQNLNHHLTNPLQQKINKNQTKSHHLQKQTQYQQKLKQKNKFIKKQKEQSIKIQKINNNNNKMKQQLMKQSKKNQKQNNITQNQSNLQQNMPMRFSMKYCDKNLQDFSVRQLQVSGCQGKVALDFKLTKKTQWQFIFDGDSRNAQLGVCQIPNDLQQGTSRWTSHCLIGFNQQVGNFKFDQTNLVKLTYHPQGILEYFNTNTKKNCAIKLQPRLQGYQYYPIVSIYKATVILWNHRLIAYEKSKKQRSKQQKEIRQRLKENKNGY